MALSVSNSSHSSIPGLVMNFSQPNSLSRKCTAPGLRGSIRAAASPSGQPISPDAASSSGAVVPPTKQAQLSFRQQARSFEARLRDTQRAIKEGFLKLPPVVAFTKLIESVLTLLRPYLMVINAQWEKVYENYCEFCSEEVKRAWRFKRQYEHEEAWWINAVHFVNVAALTLLWECCVPVSVVWAIALPMYLNWIMYDDFWVPWKSPITAGLLLIAPFKFPPWAVWVLL